ncbi:uncharacterized protein A4U43_C04F22430, partial [Asparagus officinalis]
MRAAKAQQTRASAGRAGRPISGRHNSAKAVVRSPGEQQDERRWGKDFLISAFRPRPQSVAPPISLPTKPRHVRCPKLISNTAQFSSNRKKKNPLPSAANSQQEPAMALGNSRARSSQLSPPHASLLLRPLGRGTSPFIYRPSAISSVVSSQRQEAAVQDQVEEGGVVDSKILPYCSIDKKAEKRTIGEMEQEFLQALQSFYYDGQAIMSNEEFDNLKEELMWEGSSVVML